MAKIAAQITIGEYAKWRAGFDKAAPFRKKAGVKNVQIYRDVDNPNSVLVWSEVDDLAKARAVYDSSELRKAMQEAGVVGAPKIHVIKVTPKFEGTGHFNRPIFPSRPRTRR
jgi:quinol monooxygenase YgiN